MYNFSLSHFKWFCIKYLRIHCNLLVPLSEVSCPFCTLVFHNFMTLFLVSFKFFFQRFPPKEGLTVWGIRIFLVVVVGYWYLTPLVSSYLILICWASSCLWILQRKKGGERKMFFNFNCISLGVFARLLCSEECLPGQFENCRFSQIRRYNILVVSGG